jgi:hypothetical protein
MLSGSEVKHKDDEDASPGGIVEKVLGAFGSPSSPGK